MVVQWILWFVQGTAKTFVWLLGAGLFGLWWCQGKLLYLPSFGDREGEKRKLVHNMRGYRSPSEHNIPFDDVYITCKDGTRIHCWLLKQENAAICPTIVFFHGNAGNIGFRLPHGRQLSIQTGSNVMMVDYRGYGNSEGRPSESGLCSDAQSVLDHLMQRDDVDRSKIFVYGQSLGGAVSTWLTYHNQHKVCGMILENTFTSITDMVLVFVRRAGINRGEWFIRTFLYLFMTSHWNSLSLISSIKTPTLFISGLADELIPAAQMQMMYDSATHSSCRVLHTVANGEHNDTHVRGGMAYYETFSDFISNQIHSDVHSPHASAPVGAILR